jgi:hypothetical protein
MSTGLELRTRHQSNLLSTCSLVSVRPRVATALEDKIVQRALVEVLNAIYESDFLGFSYGWDVHRIMRWMRSRPGSSGRT